jgi:hypothetical protein
VEEDRRLLERYPRARCGGDSHHARDSVEDGADDAGPQVSGRENAEADRRLSRGGWLAKGACRAARERIRGRARASARWGPNVGARGM